MTYEEAIARLDNWRRYAPNAESVKVADAILERVHDLEQQVEDIEEYVALLGEEVDEIEYEEDEEEERDEWEEDPEAWRSIISPEDHIEEEDDDDDDAEFV